MGLPKIVLECGVNHQGSVDIAKQMIEVFWNACTGYPGNLIYFKFQKRNPDICVPENQKSRPRKSLIDGRWTDYITYKHEMEFGLDEYYELDNFIRELTGHSNIFVSVWDNDSVAFVVNYFSHWSYLKIPSAHITNLSLIKECVLTGMSLIISTGMSTKQDIDKAVSLVPDDMDLTLLACTGSYPMPLEDVNLKKISTLRHHYGQGRSIGFSAHDISPFSGIYSNFLGADMIEVHGTLNRGWKGSDHAASLEPPAIELLIRETMKIPILLGSGELKIMPSEANKLKSLRG